MECHRPISSRVRVAIIDDWMMVAEAVADWEPLKKRAEIVFFTEPFRDIDAAASSLAEFDVIFAMRERQSFPARLVERLPRLKMILLTGQRTPSVDADALARRGVLVERTGHADSGASTAEMTIALLLASARDIPGADWAVRKGDFQRDVRLGMTLAGKTLGIIGLGRIGSLVARMAIAMNMQVIAWSENLTQEKAASSGVEYVDKDTLLARSDAITLHLILSERTKSIIGAAEIARMKDDALLINTSRGDLVDEQALVVALKEGRIRAALDVYWNEPVSSDHPLLACPNTVLAPHLGYSVREMLSLYYARGIERIAAFVDNPKHG